MLSLHQQKTDDAQKIQEEPMKRNTKRVALTAAAIALLSLHRDDARKIVVHVSGTPFGFFGYAPYVSII